MPNTGRPSPACYLCRKRRVKCDLTPSGCLRCAKVGTTCPGYREKQDLFFVNQTTTTYPTSRRKIRRTSKRSGAEEILTSSNSSEASPSPFPASVELSLVNSRAARSTTPPLFPAIVEDWNAHFVPIVLHRFSSPTDGNRFHGYLDFLPDLYQKSTEESCLTLATNTVATAHIANISRSLSDRHEHIKILGRALKAVNAALVDPFERVSDSTILAVWLLGYHEILVSSPDKPPIEAPESWHMHSKGIASLLRARGPYQFSTARGRNIFWMMNMLIQTQSLVASEPCPAESLDWFELIRPNVMTEADQLAFTSSFYIYKLSSLASRIIKFIRCTTADDGDLPSQFARFTSEADTLEDDIYTWQTITTPWPVDVVSLHISNTLRGGILKFQHFLIILQNRFSFHPQADPAILKFRRECCVAKIRTISGEIINSLPDTLASCPAPFTMQIKEGGWAEGLRLLYPVLAVAWMPLGLREHREKARWALQRIGRHMGIMLALDNDPPASRFVEGLY